MKTFNILLCICLLSISFFSGYAQCPASAKINEFHYDNAGGDLNEFIEIALPAGSDPTQVQIDLYNGSNGSMYDSIILSSADFVSSDGTFDYYVWNPGSIQNGNDGIAVSCLDGTQYQFITYEGPFMAADGPFAGVMGVDIGVEETSATTDAQSIMCDGSGNFLTSCTADAGAANDISTCGTPPALMGCTDVNACNYDAAAEEDDGSCFVTGDPCDDGDATTTSDVYIDCNTCQGSNIGIVNCGTPAWEVISPLPNANAFNNNGEWTPITNGFSANGFCGGGCAESVSTWLVYGPLDMTGVTTFDLVFDAVEGFGDTDLNIVYTTDYSSACPPNASWTNVAAVSDPGSITTDLSGAVGIAVYIAIEYTDDGADGYSNWELTNFQLTADVCPTLGTPIVSNCDTDAGCTDATACNYDMDATVDDGTCFSVGDACDDGNAMTTGDVYTDCATCLGTPIVAGNCPASAKINEFHYDNAGGDVNEFVEIILPSGADPTQIQVDLYNGSNGSVYGTVILSAADFVSTDGTFDYYVWNIALQNGNDGIAVSCVDGTQYQFITYEGAFMATDGPFANTMGVDVGVEEPGDAAETNSIMCDGTGVFLANCTADAGAANDLNSCVADLAGCTDVNACNYDMNATTDDGSCFSQGDSCDDGDPNTSGDVYVDCSTCQGSTSPVPGCTDTNACNYDAAATQDDGSCFSVGDACDDGDATTNNDMYVDCSTCAGMAPVTCPASAKINEFHYDNAGGDVNEFVEIALPVGSVPTSVQVDLYNGSNGSVYGTIILSAADFVSTDGTFDYYVWNIALQNGNDGIAVSCVDGTQYQFITYEGAFMATDGPFANVMGVDVGVEEPGDAAETNSIMCDGTGVFLANCTADAGAANDLSSCVADLAGCTDVNACNYDMNATTDDGSCFSVGDACDDGDPNTSGDVYLDCSTCQGSTSPVPGCTDTNACNYDAAATQDDGSCFSVGDACDDGDATTNNDMYVDCTTCAGMAPVTCPASAKINEFHYDNAGGDVNEFVEIALPVGSVPTSVQVDLYNGSNGSVYSTIILSAADFVSTDGTFDYYVWNIALQNGNDGIAVSCVDGTQYQFITYEGAFMATDGPFANTMGVDVGVEEPGDAAETNSIMCDGTGVFLANCTADAGAANDLNSCVADLAGCTDVNACNYDMNATTDDGSCFSVGDSCDDGDPNTSGDVYLDCSTCQGSTSPVPGCIDLNACNYDAAATEDDGSCFSTGDACDDGDPNTNNDVYVDCSTCAGMVPVTCPASVKINEFHYDNIGTDVNEFVEIALPFGSDLNGVQIDLYNGNNGAVYGTLVLSNAEYVTTDYYFDYYVWNIALQNGNDGIAVSCTDGTQYQFITYEGSFMATDGPFAGVMGTDIGVEEPSDAPNTSSLMCDGTGTYLANCTADAGFTNNLSSCVVDQPNCSLQSTACAACPSNTTNTSIDLAIGTTFNDGVSPVPTYDASLNTGTWTLPAGGINVFAVGGVNDLTLPNVISGGCLTADLNIISGTTPFRIEFRIENGTGAPGNGGQALTFDVDVDGTGVCSMGGDFGDGLAVNGFAFAAGSAYSVVIALVDFTGNPVATDIVVEISNVSFNVCGSDVTICDPTVGSTCDDGNANTTNDTIQADCSCAGELPAVEGCLDVNASNYDPNADTDNGSCLYLCNESNLLAVSTNTGFDGGSGLSYGAPTGMGLLTGANNDFGGFIWNANTAGLTIDQICMFIDFDITGDAAAFPVAIEFRIENGDCGGFPCPWIDFNATVSAAGTYTFGGLLNTGNVSSAGVFDPNGANTYVVAAINNFSGTPLGGNVDVVFSNLCVSDGNCVVEPTCDDPCAPNFGEAGTCDTYDDTCNQDCTVGPYGGTWDATACACMNETTPINGCTDPEFCEFNPAANCDDGSCVTSINDPGTCNTDCTLGDTEFWDIASCSCVVDVVTIAGCTNNTACNFNPNANCDDSSCDFGNTACADPCNEPIADDNCDITTDTFDAATCTVTNTPNCAAGETFNAGTCNCDTNPITGCIDMDACNFDMNANTDDGSCFYAEAATISTTSSTSICVDDGIDEPIDVTIDVSGQGSSGSWVITDQNANILALPAAPPFILDGAGIGTCLIWYVNFSDAGFAPQVGDNAADLVMASSCAALSNSISVVRSECGNCAPNSGNFPWNGQ